MIRAVKNGRTYTAREFYHSLQHSGDDREFREFTPDRALSALRRSGYDASDIDGGTVTVVADDMVVSVGMGDEGWPETTTGSADSAGFGFGGLDAKLDILNYGYTAERSFSVRKSGYDHQALWEVTVDGEVVESGDGITRPFQILWEGGGNGGVL